MRENNTQRDCPSIASRKFSKVKTYFKRFVRGFVEEALFLADRDAEVVIFHHTPYVRASHWTLNYTYWRFSSERRQFFFGFRRCEFLMSGTRLVIWPNQDPPEWGLIRSIERNS